MSKITKNCIQVSEVLTAIINVPRVSTGSINVPRVSTGSINVSSDCNNVRVDIKIVDMFQILKLTKSFTLPPVRGTLTPL